tara:strand:- start:596 stop:2548 length:1953 start_codon:yes stop_codon:yes gene_type:complete
MIDNNLISYIEQNLKNGYSASSIQNVLINQGYSAKNVLDTINYVQGNNQGAQKTPVQSQSPFKKPLFILIPVVLIIIIGLSVFFFISLSPKLISEEDFSQGTNFDLKENKEVKFNLDEEVHTLKVDSITDNSVSLTIQSNPIKVDLKIGEEKKFDLNNDGFYDIKIKLNNIFDGIPDLYVKKIHESTCVENWNCGSWSDCTEQGKQSRTCTDSNSCSTVVNKPPTTQTCTYVETCTEDWECTDWTFSTNLSVSLDFGSGEGDGSYSCIQRRNCTDNNNCNTANNKPNETRECPGSDSDFETKFKNCQPASRIHYPFGDTVHYYEEVLGSVGDLCKIKSKYLKHPNPIYEGKEMICTYDTSGGYDNLVQLTGDMCEGELWELTINPPEDPKRKVGESCGTIHKCEDDLDCINGICIVPTDDCNDDSDCGQCENCEDGQLNCVQVQDSKVCIDCLFDSACKRGYVCNSNRECVPCTNCNCIDDLDCGACNNCVSGNSMCVSTGMTKDCSDCVNDHHCNEGYKCEDYECIEDSGGDEVVECGDTVCQSNEYCAFYPQVCTPKSALGEECEEHRDSCIDGMCLDDICVAEDFFDQFASCTMNGHDCITPCTNCVSGTYTCPYIGDADGTKCVECAFQSNCKEGFKCELYECVPE